MSSKGVLRTIEGNRLGFWCPGCNEMHVITTNPGWSFNGDYDKPTFNPSILVRGGHYASNFKEGDNCWCTYNASVSEDERTTFKCHQCHSFVRNGNIEFLNDCSHKLAGQTISLQSF